VSGLEQAIRNALDRAERANPEIRARIYQSARNALDAGLRKQDINDMTVIERQRQRLEFTIRAIEDEELEKLRVSARLDKIFIENTAFEQPAPEPEPEPETAPPAPEPQVRQRQEPVVDQPPAAWTDPIAPARREPPVIKPARQAAVSRQPLAEPAMARDPEPDEDGSFSDFSATRDERMPAKAGSKTGRVEPVIDVPLVAEARGKGRGQKIRHEEEDPAWAEPSTPEGRKVAPQKRAARRRRGSWIVSLFVYCVLLGVIGFGAWWAYATGMIGAAMHGGGDFDFIPKELQSEDFDPKAPLKNPLDPQRSFSGDWVSVLKPGDTSVVTPAAQAKVSDVTDSDGKAILIASNAPDQDGEVRIAVPADVLKAMAGKTSTLAVTLRADGDKPSQIYIQCAFASLGDCGRHRFTISNERVDELIQVKFDGKSAPSEPGYVVINSDLTGQGRAIRLYGIRIGPGA
jgi:hypothetical protein